MRVLGLFIVCTALGYAATGCTQYWYDPDRTFETCREDVRDCR